MSYTPNRSKVDWAIFFLHMMVNIRFRVCVGEASAPTRFPYVHRKSPPIIIGQCYNNSKWWTERKRRKKLLCKSDVDMRLTCDKCNNLKRGWREWWHCSTSQLFFHTHTHNHWWRWWCTNTSIRSTLFQTDEAINCCSSCFQPARKRAHKSYGKLFEHGLNWNRQQKMKQNSAQIKRMLNFSALATLYRFDIIWLDLPESNWEN